MWKNAGQSAICFIMNWMLALDTKRSNGMIEPRTLLISLTPSYEKLRKTSSDDFAGLGEHKRENNSSMGRKPVVCP